MLAFMFFNCTCMLFWLSLIIIIIIIITIVIEKQHDNLWLTQRHGARLRPQLCYPEPRRL